MQRCMQRSCVEMYLCQQNSIKHCKMKCLLNPVYDINNLLLLRWSSFGYWNGRRLCSLFAFYRGRPLWAGAWGGDWVTDADYASSFLPSFHPTRERSPLTSRSIESRFLSNNASLGVFASRWYWVCTIEGALEFASKKGIIQLFIWGKRDISLTPFRRISFSWINHA